MPTQIENYFILSFANSRRPEILGVSRAGSQFHRYVLFCQDSKSVSASEDDDDNIDKSDLYLSRSDESENEENFQNKLDESDEETRQEEGEDQKMKKFSTPGVNELEKAKAVVHQIG